MFDDVLAYRLLKSANLSNYHEELIKATIPDLEFDIMTYQLKKTFSDASGQIPTKTRSTTAVDPQLFKAKEYDINLTKNYCITISIKKISSIHKVIIKIQQILGSHELKSHGQFRA